MKGKFYEQNKIHGLFPHSPHVALASSSVTIQWSATLLGTAGRPCL